MFHIARITKVGLHPTYVLTTTKPPLLKTLQWSKQRRKIIDRLFYSQSFTRHHTPTHTRIARTANTKLSSPVYQGPVPHNYHTRETQMIAGQQSLQSLGS